MSRRNKDKAARRRERLARKEAWALTYQDQLQIEADLADRGHRFAGNRAERRGNPTARKGERRFA